MVLRSQAISERDLALLMPTDDETPAEPVVVEKDGVVVSYSCAVGSVTEEYQDQLQEVSLDFDYEFVLPDPQEELVEVLVQDVPLLQWGILSSVSYAIGIIPCNNVSSQDIDLWGGTDPDETYVVGLSTGGDGSLDTRVGECEFLLEGLDPSRICVPMRGTLAVSYVGNNYQGVENLIRYHLANEMDQGSLLINNFEATFYVGERVIRLPAPAVTEEGGSSSSFNIALASSLVLAGVILVLLVAAFVTRKRQNEDEAIELTDGPRFGNKEEAVVRTFQVVEPGLTLSASTATSSTAEQLNRSGDLEALNDSFSPNSSREDVEIDTATTASSTTAVQSEINSTESTYAVENVRRRGSGPVDLDDEIPSPTVSRNQHGIMLPPLPPNLPNSKPPSKSIKRKRRKKKKVKKKILVRTNSRGSIDEMEPIAEEDQSDGLDDDEGSEYSWSTDGSDSRPGSRDPSPARSINSPRDDITSNTFNTTSTITTNPSVIAATDNIDNIAANSVPSPIQEEKKIRPLPPPWI